MFTIAAPLHNNSAGQLTLSTEWLNPSVVRIIAAGDIDASNARRLADYVFHRAANCQHMILDLHQVAFFGTAGFTSLRTIDTRCSRAGVEWTLIPSKAITRVVNICDPRASLPIVAA